MSNKRQTLSDELRCAVHEGKKTHYEELLLSAADIIENRNAASSVDLTNFGYADGGYIGKCSHCKASFTGDKRAWSCKSCAEKKALEPKTKSVAPSTDALAGLARWQQYTIGTPKMISADDGAWCEYSDVTAIVAHLTKRLKATESAMDKVIDEKIEVAIRAEALEADRNHWKANHDNMVQRNAVLSQRPDLPVDRLPAIREYERMLAAKGAEIDKAKMEINALLVSYVREHFPDSKAFQPLGDLSGVISQLDNAITITREFKNRAEAAETEIEKLKEQNDKFKWQVRDTCTRAEMAEAKLTHLNGVKGVNSQYAFALANLGMGENDDPEIFASRLNDKLERLSQYEAQKPVGSRELRGDGTYGWSQYVYKGWQPLYASPAPSADLKAENERLREALKAIDKNAVGSMVPSSVISALVDAALNAKTSV